jgi:hypothetical protein
LLVVVPSRSGSAVAHERFVAGGVGGRYETLSSTFPSDAPST